MQDDIPVIVKAVVEALSMPVQSDIPNNKTHSTQNTVTDSDGTQTCQPASTYPAMPLPIMTAPGTANTCSYKYIGVLCCVCACVLNVVWI